MKEKSDWLCKCKHKYKHHILATGIGWFCEGVTRFKHGWCDCTDFKLDNFWFIKIYGKKAKKKC